MRIIDSEGTTDIQYENTVLAIDDGHIIAYCGDRTILMAVYSDIETAKKAMRKLRIAYQKVCHHPIDVMVGDATEYFQFPTEEQL